MAYEWANQENRDKLKRGAKESFNKAVKGFDYAARPFQPVFVGEYLADLFKNAAKAAQVSGIDVDPKAAAQLGGGIGAGVGAISALTPKLNIAINPLMQSALGASLLDQYRVSENLANIAEYIDPLGVNRNNDNVSFWDRAALGLSDPGLLMDVALAIKDSPTPVGWLINSTPFTRDTYKYGAAKGISEISKARARYNPEKYNYYEPEDLYGVEYVPDESREGVHVKPQYIGLNQTPLKDWLWETGKAMFDPREWWKSGQKLGNTVAGIEEKQNER